MSSFLGAGCKLDEPELPLTGSSSFATGDDSTTPGVTPSSPPSSPSSASENGITAPSIVGPPPGASFTDPRPTLTVTNATSDDGSALTYAFQVATDDGFRDVVAEVDGQASGNGITAWRVTPALNGGRYFWRARAEGSRGAGPYSPVSDFTIRTASAPPPSPPSAGEIFDPLTNGASVGQVSGGRFGSKGWQVTHRGNFIHYIVPTITSGFVEWENLGLSRFNPRPDLFTLFGMWDPTLGAYRENPFRVHVRKLDTNGHNPPYVRLRFISGGDQHDVGWDFLDWDPNRAYRWRVEWGPGAGGNEARVLLDGRLVIRTGYGPAYRPSDHYIEMGVEERAESIVGVFYRNVRIGRR